MTDISPIRYRIAPSHPEAHIYSVECRVQAPDSEGQRFSLPAWIPGSYMIRDFARNIVRISASADGKPLSFTKIDKHTWVCEPTGSPTLEIRYEVYAWDLSVRSAHLDQTHAYFNGTSVFLAPMGMEDRPCEVEIVRPGGDYAKEWRVATGMASQQVDIDGFGLYLASNYDELIDCPVEIGDLTVVEFEACGVPHQLAIYGRLYADTDLERLKTDLVTICEHHIRFFGEPAPMSRYVFLLMVTGDGYGGLEHRNSSSNICKRDDLPRVGRTIVTEEYRGLLGLLSHEYFHTWNVKRIKPAKFLPYDLNREVHTSLMWVFEGITSYYDDLSLCRTGLIPPDSYLELLGRQMTRLWRGNGRTKQTVLESSFDAWTKFYKQDENAPNSIVSYYVKGALIALGLDLTIRLRSDHQLSLDDVMQALWQRHGKPAIGLDEEAMEKLCEEVTGLDLSDYFARALRSTDDLNLEHLLIEFGVELRWRPQGGQDDRGGNSGELIAKPALGARVEQSSVGGARLTHVFDQGAAQIAGLAAGDDIIAIDGLRVSKNDIEKRIAGLPFGDPVEVIAFRRDEMMAFQLPVLASPGNTAFLEIKDPTKLEHWIHSSEVS